MAAFCLEEIELMYRIGQESAALALALEMLRTLPWEHVKKRSGLIADTWLRVAGLYWKQARYLQSLAATGRAVTARPFVAGRPLKRLLHRIQAA